MNGERSFNETSTVTPDRQHESREDETLLPDQLQTNNNDGSDRINSQLYYDHKNSEQSYHTSPSNTLLELPPQTRPKFPRVQVTSASMRSSSKSIHPGRISVFVMGVLTILGQSNILRALG